MIQMKHKKALERAIAIVGSQAEVARKLKVSQPTVFYWLRENRRGVPVEYAAQMEQATGGLVKREELRPDIFGKGAVMSNDIKNRLARLEGKCSFGFTVRWHDLDRGLSSVTVNNLKSLDAAKREAFEIAADNGWTPRRWWQLWRFRDTHTTDVAMLPEANK